MAAKVLPIYRLPTMPKQGVGTVSVKKDRNGKYYISGTRVEEIEEAGEFRILTLRDGKNYIVLASELAQI